MIFLKSLINVLNVSLLRCLYKFRANVFYYTFFPFFSVKFLRILTLPVRKKCPFSELFWSVFSRIQTYTERYSVFLRVQSECEKIWTGITDTNTDTFYAVKREILIILLYLFLYRFFIHLHFRTTFPIYFKLFLTRCNISFYFFLLKNYHFALIFKLTSL